MYGIDSVLNGYFTNDTMFLRYHKSGDEYPWKEVDFTCNGVNFQEITATGTSARRISSLLKSDVQINNNDYIPTSGLIYSMNQILTDVNSRKRIHTAAGNTIKECLISSVKYLVSVNGGWGLSYGYASLIVGGVSMDSYSFIGVPVYGVLYITVNTLYSVVYRNDDLVIVHYTNLTQQP